MRRLLAPVSSALALSQLWVSRAFADLPDPPTIPGLEESTDIKAVIVNLLVTVLDFVLLIAVVFVIVAGIRLIVSSGDEGEKDKAKKTIIYVIVGILIILLARVLVTFVAGLL